MRVYCASPYSSADPRQVIANILHAEQVGVEVRRLGHIPLVPHIALPPFALSVEDAWVPAMRECLSHLVSCDAVLLTGEWASSRGCQVEHAAAVEAGMTVFHSLADLEAA